MRTVDIGSHNDLMVRSTDPDVKNRRVLNVAALLGYLGAQETITPGAYVRLRDVVEALEEVLELEITEVVDAGN